MRKTQEFASTPPEMREIAASNIKSLPPKKSPEYEVNIQTQNFQSI